MIIGPASGKAKYYTCTGDASCTYFSEPDPATIVTSMKIPSTNDIILVGEMGSTIFYYSSPAYGAKTLIANSISGCGGILSLANSWTRQYIVVGCVNSRVYVFLRSGVTNNYAQNQNLNAGSR